MDIKWSIRSYESGDETKIRLLHKHVFDHDDDESQWYDWWRWQHQQNPSGPPIIFFADAGEELAGQYEVVRFKALYDGKEIDACHSQDTMTHPGYRRQGIFEVLANKTYDKAREEGIGFVFGFPNQNSYPGFVKKLDWFDICKIPNVFKPLNVKNTIRHRIKNRSLQILISFFASVFFGIYRKNASPKRISGLTYSKIDLFDKKFDELWDRSSKYYPTLVIRNKDHLNWRFKDIPHRKYTAFAAYMDGKVLGYIVLALVRKGDFTGGEIIDIFAEPDVNIIRGLLKRAQDHFNEAGADAMYCWLPKMDVFTKAFKKQGFVYLTSIPVFIARVISDNISKEKLKDYSNWFVTMGDSDFH
ncbi:MAG: GNAT family N-acetyltransferase [Candidatus Thermoplasmatota archaeon]|nr:GNAT family N-acetyltransferase [Candidatus Thermoplasmatota archaeon]